jgi:hypothetical protein
VHGVLTAILAMFLHFQALFQDFLILPGKIIDGLALGALQLDHVVLGHRL